MEQRAKLDALMLQLVSRNPDFKGKSWFYFLDSDTVNMEGREIDWHCCLCNKEVINSSTFEYPDPSIETVDEQLDQHAFSHLKEYSLLAFL